MSSEPLWSARAKVELGEFRLDVSVQARGALTALIGASGAGKSTLLGVLSGLVKPTSGQVILAGRTLFDSDEGIWLPPHQRAIGVVFQDIRLFPHLSVADNLTYSRRHAVRPISGPLAALTEAEVTSLLAIEGLMGRRTEGLSGGEAQRVALGRALLSAPELLLLDEPLSALDVPLRDSFLGFLEQVEDELQIPMVYVSHNLREVARLTDGAVVLSGGKVVSAGTFTELAMFGPLAARSDVVNPLRVHPVSENMDTDTVEFALDGADHVRLVASRQAPNGPSSTLFVRPADIALSLEPIAGLSIRNQLPGVVRRIAKPGACVLVEIDVGQPLVAEVTSGSADALALEPGRQVTCLIKSRALSYGVIPRG